MPEAPAIRSPATTSGNGQVTDHDVAFVWLNDRSQRETAKAQLLASVACPTVDPVNETARASITLICAGNGGAVIDLATVPGKFGNPANGRTPDSMLQPNPGVICTTSAAKDLEQGGFAPDDGHVALLVANPSLEERQVNQQVKPIQVARPS
jgi:hypothetical protein